jgi:CNT family concentrative nucleoside transporter
MDKIGILGILAFIGLGYLMSRDKNRIDWKTVRWGLGLQWIFAILILKGEWLASRLSSIPFPRGMGWAILGLMFAPVLYKRLTNRNLNKLFVRRLLLPIIFIGLVRGNLIGTAFDKMRGIVEGLTSYAAEGSAFVFGPLQPPAFAIFAFTVLPVIIFVASIFAVFYYLGIMQWVVGVAARSMGRFLKVSGAESVNVAASILMGQTEAPLTIRPFLSKLTRSELMVIMTAGMAHVSGAIMVAYVQIAKVDVVHLLTAVIMTAPGAIMMAKIMEPETGIPETDADIQIIVENQDVNILDAAARGAYDGGQLAFNVAVMLIAFIALVAMVNGMLGGINSSWSLEAFLGIIFKPVAILMGVPIEDAGQIGSLLGKRMVINEFVAFSDLGQIPINMLTEQGRMIATFALCGFANFSSIAIQLGGIGALIPERRGDLARLGLRAMIAGTLANFMSASIAGLIS